MTPSDRIAAIRERLSRATPGEWRLMEGIRTIWVDAPDAHHSICDMDVIRPPSDRPVARLDGDLIAHAGGADGDLAWLLGIAEAAENLVVEYGYLHTLDCDCAVHKLMRAFSTYDAALKVRI